MDQSDTLSTPALEPINENEKKRRTLEILRVSATFLTQNQISIRNNLFPFIVLSVLGYVAVVPNALLKETEVLGPTVDKVMFGIPVTPVAIAIGLLVVFMRFGFSLFHGLDLACSNKNLIVQANFDEAEREVLLQSFKDAYLIDTFLIYLNKPLLRQDIKIRQKRLAALIVNFILNASLLYAQFIVVMAFAQKSPMWAYGAAGLYFVLFAIFASKVIALPKMYQEISETRPRPIYIISGIYLLLPILSALISVLVLSGMI